MKLFVAVPVYQDMPVDFARCLLQLWPFVRFLQGESLIPRARNCLSADFLQTDCTHCLFIDCDILFTTQDVERLLSHYEAIVGGLYPIKRDGELIYSAEALPDLPPPDERGLLPLRYIGTGFLLVRRDVLESMITAYGDEISYIADRTRRLEHDFWRVGVYKPGQGQPARYMSEDWFFCQRALDLGFKVYADTRVVLKHIGTINYPATSQEARWDDNKGHIVNTNKGDKQQDGS